MLSSNYIIYCNLLSITEIFLNLSIQFCQKQLVASSTSWKSNNTVSNGNLT